MDKKTTIGSDKIRSLFDAGTFVEIGAYVRGALSKDTFDGLICGYGSIDGKLTFAFVQDMDRYNGALDEPGAKKLRALYALAMKNGAPVVGMFDSMGAVVYDGTAALDAYGTWMRCVSDASGIVPQIALIGGVCAGSALVAASMFDFIYTVKDASKLYLDVNDADPTDALAAKVCESEAEAVASVRALISMLPQNNCDHCVADAEDPSRALANNAVLPKELLDGGSMLTLYDGIAPEMTVAFGRMGGETVGVICAQGCLTGAGADKAARMVRFCDAFHLPLITLIDSDGVESCAVSSYAKLASAYATANCAKISVVIGHAYGLSYTLLGSRALGADMVYALPSAQIGTMTPDRAVAFVWNDKVTGEVSREEVEAEWVKTYAVPEIAAARGDIDDIIPVEELRMRLCSAVYMLAAKADGMPTRRHPSFGL